MEEQTKGLDIEFYRLGFISKKGFKKDVAGGKYNLFELGEFYKE